MDTGKVTNTSTGKKYPKTQALASASVAAVKPLLVVPLKPVSNSTLKTLADTLSRIQEDCRKYQATLAEYLPENKSPVSVHFKGDGIIYFVAPLGHRLDTGKIGKDVHIFLDGKPVTNWTLADTGES